MNALAALIGAVAVLLATVTNMYVTLRSLRQSQSNGRALNGQHAAAMTEIKGLKAAVLDAGGTVPVDAP